MSKAHGSQRIDPLSEALSAMHMESSLLAIFKFASPWAVTHPHLDGFVCHLIAEGNCCWTAPERSACIQLQKGDLIAFPHGDVHTLASSPGLTGAPIVPLLNAIGHPLWKPQAQYMQPVRYSGEGSGERTVVIDMISEIHDPLRNPLLRSLPEVIHIPAAQLRVMPWFDMLLDLITGEQATTPGYAAAVSRIADLIFIQVVRTYLCLHADDARGWLRGLLHPKIGRALQAIHHAPERDWTVAALAAEAGMSRTPFARDFLDCLGRTPIHYLTEWRMHIASRRLAAGIPVNIVSDELGYASPISFARTFKRVLGVNPGSVRRCRGGREALDGLADERPRPEHPAGARVYPRNERVRRPPSARQ